MATDQGSGAVLWVLGAAAARGSAPAAERLRSTPVLGSNHFGPATFDTGIIVEHGALVRCLWVEDED